MKRIISLLFVFILCFVFFCVPSFAAYDISEVDFVYSNKIDNSTGFIGCSFGDRANDEAVPLNRLTKKNERFKTPNSFSSANMQNPVMIVTFYRENISATLHTDEKKVTGRVPLFGTTSGDNRLSFSFTFEASTKVSGFADPHLEDVMFTSFGYLLGEENLDRKYVHLQSRDYDFTVTRKSVGSSYYYTYTLSFFEDDVGVPFGNIRLILSLSSGSYYYVPMLRGYSGKSVSRYDYENSLDSEKHEAQQSGNENVDKLTGAIGIDTSGFLSGFQNLASAMSYDGTDANWTMPAIYIPEIQGVTGRIDLTDEQPIDLASFVSKIPDEVLSIIQSLFTIALVVFCGKELYDLISYLFTLKGGGSDG